MVPGGGAAHLVDSLGKSCIRYVPCLHEQGAGYAAVAYAQYRNGLGVCLVTSGPGATNAVTPCAAAWMDSVPVLFISGQALSSTLVGETGLRTRGVQEVDIMPVVEPITKMVRRPISGERAVMLLRTMIDIALQGRPGPVWLDLCLDTQAEDCNV